LFFEYFYATSFFGGMQSTILPHTTGRHIRSHLFKPSQLGYKGPLNKSCSAPEKGSQRPSNKEFRFRQGKNPGRNSVPGTTKSMDLYVRVIPTCVRLILKSENFCGVTGKVGDGREKPECFTRGPSSLPGPKNIECFKG
jgi:hypothetical protein